MNLSFRLQGEIWLAAASHPEQSEGSFYMAHWDPSILSGRFFASHFSRSLSWANHWNHWGGRNRFLASLEMTSKIKSRFEGLEMTCCLDFLRNHQNSVETKTKTASGSPHASLHIFPLLPKEHFNCYLLAVFGRPRLSRRKTGIWLRHRRSTGPSWWSYLRSRRWARNWDYG